MYPPDDILKEQCEFLQSMACFVQKSSIQPLRKNSTRHFQDPGRGAFVGRGIAKDTILFYSGLLYFGEYNEGEMFKLWQTKFNEALSTNWQNKVYKIHSHCWIIGNPKEWTSYLNTNSIEALCHARIVVGDLGMIQFRQAAFSFDEVFVGYSNRLTMTTHQSANTQPPVAVSQHLGKDVVTSDNREVCGLIKPLKSLTEPFQSAEQS